MMIIRKIVEDKKLRARSAVMHEMLICGRDDFENRRDEILNDAANSVAESYEEYMEIWAYLLIEF